MRYLVLLSIACVGFLGCTRYTLIEDAPFPPFKKEIAGMKIHINYNLGCPGSRRGRVNSHNLFVVAAVVEKGFRERGAKIKTNHLTHENRLSFRETGDYQIAATVCLSRGGGGYIPRGCGSSRKYEAIVFISLARKRDHELLGTTIGQHVFYDGGICEPFASEAFMRAAHQAVRGL